MLKKLPPNFNRSGEHLQIIEKFIADTRLCLRQIRNTKFRSIEYNLEQTRAIDGNEMGYISSHFVLNKDEFDVLKRCDGEELRFNRYLYENELSIEVFLGYELNGLFLAKLDFATREEMDLYQVPVLDGIEVTNQPLFRRQNLAGKNISDLKSMPR